MTYHKVSEAIIFRPQGRLDHEGGMLLQTQLAAIASERCAYWVLDMTHIEFINSAGLVALISGLSLAQEQQRRLILCNLSASMRLIFEISQLDQVFEIVEDAGMLLSELEHKSAPRSTLNTGLAAA